MKEIFSPTFYLLLPTLVIALAKTTLKPWPLLAPYGKTLSIPGGELFYYDSAGDTDSERDTDSAGDSDKPTLILIHGLGDEADTWRHVFPLFAEAGYRVIAPDLPGFGRSLWKGRISVRRHCMAVLHLMAETGAASARQPATLAGSSLGAGVVEMIAGMRPDLVKAVILIDGCFPVSDGMDRRLYLLALPFIGKRWYRGFRTNHEAAHRSLYPYYGDFDAMSGADREFLRERVIARVESPNQERGYLNSLRSMDGIFLFGKRSLTNKIKHYPGKIFLIWGGSDRIVPKEKADIFLGLRADAELAVVPGAGHLPHQEKPQETAAAMLSFLANYKTRLVL